MITLSADTNVCPACDSPLIAQTTTQRACNACGFSAVLVTPEDELEAELLAKRTRNEGGKAHSIARFQTRW